jgi:hypothetical protein
MMSLSDGAAFKSGLDQCKSQGIGCSTQVIRKSGLEQCNWIHSDRETKFLKPSSSNNELRIRKQEGEDQDRHEPSSSSGSMAGADNGGGGGCCGRSSKEN